MGFYAPHVLLGDAKRHNISVMRVAINSSCVRCTAIEGHVLLGFMMVRSLGEEMAEAIVAERETNGPYQSLADLLRRTGLPYQIAENLIAVGALSEFGLSRRDLLWQLGLLMPRSASWRAAANAFGRGPRSRGQLTLALSTQQDMAQLRDMDEWERMVADYGLLGLSPSFTPLSLLRSRLPKDIRSSAELRVSRDGERSNRRTRGLQAAASDSIRFPFHPGRRRDRANECCSSGPISTRRSGASFRASPISVWKEPFSSSPAHSICSRRTPARSPHCRAC